MTPITDRLSALAAQMREDARQAGINATKARPAVEKTAADVEAARKLLAEAEKAHREAEAVVARHEKDGQEAADMAAKLDRLAAEHRTPPELPTPDEAVAAAGLAPEEACICTKGRSPEDYDGPQRDCPVHGEPPMPADWLFNVVPASPQSVAAVEQATGGLEVVRHPAAPGLDSVVAVHGPGVTAPMTGGPRHEKPKERPGPLARITRRTGPHRVIASPDATRPDADVPDALLAEGERRARPDDSKENDR